jgi:hypothetical protein
MASLAGPAAVSGSLPCSVLQPDPGAVRVLAGRGPRLLAAMAYRAGVMG